MKSYPVILITGGAGFVGSSLAMLFKRDFPECRIISFDNLRRRGSELTIHRLVTAGIEFFHGDIRSADDLAAVGPFDLLLDCSAEPSVHAGYNESPMYVIQTNLLGTVHCLEAARRHQADIVFLSSSRVYSIPALRDLPLQQQQDRLVIPESCSGPGWSSMGLTRQFPCTGYRSMYGATKLSSEMLIEEYGAMYGLRAIINRCGVLTGPWQMGKVDQGFVVLWLARHFYGGSLAYMGFGGQGHQVRDILHVSDLYRLLTLQLMTIDQIHGVTYNVGGGPGGSVSLCELTRICQKITGNTIEIQQKPVTTPADIPYYVTDNTHITLETGWKPEYTTERILEEIFVWLTEHKTQLKPILS
ncbi:MAG: NAD-dependent epimerase/dehydratase family protein [Magnetococcus sp. YQC-5]